MKLSDFDYKLNKNFIAQFPPQVRGASRLMVLDRKRQETDHARYFDLPKFLATGDCVVLNNTRVIPARLKVIDVGAKKRVEIFLLRNVDPLKNIWEVLIGGAKKIKNEEVLLLEDGTKVYLIQNIPGQPRLVRFPTNFEKILSMIGKMPLPPYIKREADIEDEKRYQTVFAKKVGAVAAPTAALNFTTDLIKKLKQKGIRIVYVTLHVGYGTFAPVSEENIETHKIHSEWFSIEQTAAKVINKTKESGGRIIAVGTTATRVSETVSDKNGFVKPFEGESKLFIYPGYKFRCVDILLTNFHAPKTTVLMLAAAFAGKDFLFKAYEIAKERGYTFLSYGDSMLIK